ncbi:hypothetical protein [Nocardia asiatica]|uniref:hypothetical protein n=1 Tax=Nocardia asiatica TaxID=209252 RepID=UPI0005C18DF5|nr:hypothetical protein [Nocardia asiatica]
MQSRRAAASDLVALLDAARNADVLTSDPRLEILVDHDNTPQLPGFTLMLRNYSGGQESGAVTTGITEILFPDSGLSTAAAIRFHLEHIVEIANGLLHLITGRL